MKKEQNNKSIKWNILDKIKIKNILKKEELTLGIKFSLIKQYMMKKISLEYNLV